MTQWLSSLLERLVTLKKTTSSSSRWRLVTPSCCTTAWGHIYYCWPDDNLQQEGPHCRMNIWFQRRRKERALYLTLSVCYVICPPPASCLPCQDSDIDSKIHLTLSAMGWIAQLNLIFLATLVALHFTPVSVSVGDSFGLGSSPRTTIAWSLRACCQHTNTKDIVTSNDPNMKCGIIDQSTTEQRNTGDIRSCWATN